MSDTHFMAPEDVKRMCEKSKRLSGAKWKWQKICRKHNLTWQSVEESYDTIIKRQEKMYEKLRRQSDKQLGNDGRTASGDAEAIQGKGNEKEVRSAGKGDSTSEPSGSYRTNTDSISIPVRISGPIDGRDSKQTTRDADAKRKGTETIGKEIRSGETQDGPVTTEGVE